MHVHNAWLTKLKKMATKNEMQVTVRTTLIPVVHNLYLCFSDIVFRWVYRAFQQHSSTDHGCSNSASGGKGITERTCSMCTLHHLDCFVGCYHVC